MACGLLTLRVVHLLGLVKRGLDGLGRLVCKVVHGVDVVVVGVGGVMRRDGERERDERCG